MQRVVVMIGKCHSILQITSESQTSSNSLLSISNDYTPPSSATLISSVSSLPSPLFNWEIVDAFLSVPATTPTSTHCEKNLPTPTVTKASFDSALLSSAIYFTSTYKTGTSKAKSKHLPSERAATIAPTRTSIFLAAVEVMILAWILIGLRKGLELAGTVERNLMQVIMK